MTSHFASARTLAGIVASLILASSFVAAAAAPAYAAPLAAHAGPFNASQTV